jgi:hypothetical protein
MYLRIKNAEIEYPFNLRTLKLENPNVSFPSEVGDDLLAEYGVYPVTAVPPPSSTMTQDAVEQTPQQIDGVWTQAWAMVDVSPEEATFRQRDEAEKEAAQAIKADAFVQSFISMTPAQVTAYIENNTANLAQVRSLLVKISLMLLALARREYRD